MRGGKECCLVLVRFFVWYFFGGEDRLLGLGLAFLLHLSRFLILNTSF